MTQTTPQPANAPGPGGLDLGAARVAKGRRSLLVAAGLIWSAERGELLVAKRRASDYLGGLWEFPGGKVEPFEDPRQALAREIEEELGAVVDVGRVVETIYHETADFAVVILCYLCELRPGSEPRPIEADEVAWTPLSRLDALAFVPGDVAFVQSLAQAARRGERPLG